jgi:hypothetical protein
MAGTVVSFTGRADAGTVVLTGATVGQQVQVMDSTGADVSGNFGAFIVSAGQLIQRYTWDFSGQTLYALLT